MRDGADQHEWGNAWAMLRRRKVVQWGLAYAASGWALLQVLGFAADAFHWPDGAKQFAMLILALGLPVAVTLAWFHGDRGEQRVSRTEIAILALILCAGGGAIWFVTQRSASVSTAGLTATDPTQNQAVSAVPADTRPSIAVLPFVNMSPEPDQEFFSDGMSEQVLDLLAKIPQLRVMARTSSFSFKGKEVDAATIAHSLGVSHLLEGSVRKSGNQLRISAKLLRATDGSQLWSETYDRQLEDIFKIQDEIAGAVVTQLKVQMLGTSFPVSRPTDPAVFAQFLRAKQLYRARSQASLAQATALLERLLAVNDRYEPAWQLLGRAYAEQAWVGFLPLHEGYAKARAALLRAIDVDPSDAAAIGALGSLAQDYDINLPEAARRLKQALMLEPNNESALRAAGNLTIVLGDDRRSIAIFEDLTRQDPVNSQAWGDLGYAYLMFGRHADSIAAIHKSLELEPGASTRHEHLVEAKLALGDPAGALAAIQLEPNDVVRKLGLSYVHAATGQREAALRLLQEVGRDSPEWATMIAAGYARLDERDRTFEWLERALRERDGGVVSLRVDPAFRRVRSDPRYQPLLVRIGISDEQVKALDFNIAVPTKAGAT